MIFKLKFQKFCEKLRFGGHCMRSVQWTPNNNYYPSKNRGKRWRGSTDTGRDIKIHKYP